MAERLLARLTPTTQRRILNLAFRLGRLQRLRLGIDDRRAARGDEVAVQRVLETETVESLAAEAERYFAAQAANPTLLRKPFTTVDEASDHLIAFCHVLMGLQLLPGMRVLDFGAGLGWTSRILLQLDCEVVVCDVSRSALEQARRAVDSVGWRPAGLGAQFLPFDGHRIDLPDASVDRISCFDAFHHVPNQDEVLAEFARVLRSGGIAGFSEPGPNHSKTGPSQLEMRNYRILENDVLVSDISGRAQRVGFSDVKLALFMRKPSVVSIREYQRYLRSGQPPTTFRREMHSDLRGSRIFFLSKDGQPARDSRQPHGLNAQLRLSPVPGAAAAADGRFRVHAVNVGTTAWLPSGTSHGSVSLGAHLYNRDGGLVTFDFARYPLPFQGCLAPGASVDFEIDVRVPEHPAVVGFDMVSEGVAWFELNGSQTVKVRL